jgi:hypothetical protein
MNRLVHCDVKPRKDRTMNQNQQQPKKPVDWDELYPGRFLKAGELHGKKVTLTISDITTEELVGDSGKKVKGILAFKETPKAIALNRTNGTCLREMFGRKLSEWIGKRITIFPGEWNGEPCIRIWGSPDIQQDMSIEVALPRRRPIPMTMHVVRPSNGQQRPQQTQQRQTQRREEPADDLDPEPGANDGP